MTRSLLAGLVTLTAALAGCGRAALDGPAERARPGMTAAAHRQQGPGWYAVQLHAHSTYSDGKLGVAALIAEAKAAGLDALAITDHDTTATWLDPAFVTERELVMLRSQESGAPRGGNHVGLHGFTGATAIRPDADREAYMRAAAARGATVIINHPCNHLLPWKPLTLDSRAHAIEVWNSWFWSPVDQAADDHAISLRPNEDAIRWWAANLARGARVAAVAAADFHRWPQSLAGPCTLIYAGDRTESALLAGLRAGRTTLANGPRAERLELDADGDGDGRFEAMVGDTVPAASKLRVRVTGGEGLTLRILRGATEVARLRVPGADWRHEVSLPPAPAGGAPFVYARLDGTSLAGTTMRAMTSAIYLR